MRNLIAQRIVLVYIEFERLAEFVEVCQEDAIACDWIVKRLQKTYPLCFPGALSLFA